MSVTNRFFTYFHESYVNFGAAAYNKGVNVYESNLLNPGKN